MFAGIHRRAPDVGVAGRSARNATRCAGGEHGQGWREDRAVDGQVDTVDLNLSRRSRDLSRGTLELSRLSRDLSGGREDGQADRSSSVRHTAVVGDELGKPVAQHACCGEVDRVQAAQVAPAHRGRLVKQRIVKTQQ